LKKTDKARDYIIMRHPCLPEDEGRQFFVKSFGKREEAEKWVKAQKGNYFRPDYYYIVEALTNDF